MKLQCILADDEPLARKGLENFIREVPFLELTASCPNALQLIEVMASGRPDLLFLDIQMPKLSGLELLKSMPQKPLTIITTAFPNYAVESYELDVLDYLVKPIPFERFLKAVNKAKDFYELKNTPRASAMASDDFFFLKCDNRYEKIHYNEILYVEALQNYVVIFTETQKYISYLTLKAVETQLPQAGFVKISKSHIISLAKIKSIEANEVTLAHKKLTIGRAYKDQAMQLILNDRLLKR